MVGISSTLSLDQALALVVQNLQNGRIAEAETLCRKVLSASPMNGPANFYLGLIAQQGGRPADAVLNIERAQKLGVADPQTFQVLAAAFVSLGRFPDAEKAIRKALAKMPRAAEAHLILGHALQGQGRFDDAASSYRAATKADPKSATAHYNLGVALAAAGRREEAAKAYGSAIKASPALFQAHANLGVIWHDLGKWNEAIACYDRALEINPNDAETINNRAILYRDTGSFAQAARDFQKALELRPASADVHRNFGLLLLLTQQFERGWAEYEWRWQCADFQGRDQSHKLPRWDGRPIPGGNLLIWNEQGLGDEILFSGMMDEVARQAATAGFSVTWATEERLVPLFQRSCPELSVISSQEIGRLVEKQGITAQIPSGSIGQYLRPHLDRFPADRPAYLRASKDRIAEVREALRKHTGDREPPLYVGISWSSANRDIGALKTVGLTDILQAINAPSVCLIDLQYGDTQEERRQASERTGMEIIHVDALDLTRDIDGVAALISCCDHVVSVSNTTAHLAAALGTPTTVLIPAASGKLWYWGAEKPTTPWYPGVRLVRQSGGGSWAQALSDVAGMLSDTSRMRNAGEKQP
ncbi:MAG: glycosyltransferase family protein [Rhodobacteraceae bacterium]|nr:glycosyltransferase family protein [Paracoccaceae bacterium]